MTPPPHQNHSGAAFRRRGVRLTGSIVAGALLAGGMSAVALPASAASTIIDGTDYSTPKGVYGYAGATGDSKLWFQNTGAAYTGTVSFTAQVPSGARFRQTGALRSNTYITTWVATPSYTIEDNCTLSDFDRQISCILPNLNWPATALLEIGIPNYLAPSMFDQKIALGATITVGAQTTTGRTWTAAPTLAGQTNRFMALPMRGTITGQVHPGARLVITDSTGAVVATPVPDGITGAWSFPAPAYSDVLTATVTEVDGTVVTVTAVYWNSLLTVGAPAAGASLPALGAVSGTGDPGSRITVVDDAGVPVGSATTSASGTWSIPATPELAVGARTLTVSEVTVRALTRSTTVGVTILDVTAPALPVVNPTGGSVVTGSGEPGAAVTVTNSSGSVIGTGTVGPDGTFSLPLSPAPADGAELSVTLTDAAGNTSAQVGVTVDAVAPAPPVVEPSNGSAVSGRGEPGAAVVVTDAAGAVIGSGVVQADGTFTVAVSPAAAHGSTLSVTLSDAAGNISAGTPVVIDAEAPAAPVVHASNGMSATGTAEPGSIIRVTDATGTVIGIGTADASGDYSVSLSPRPVDGTVLTVTASDAAGNTSAGSETTVDATGPAAPVLSPTVGDAVTGTGEAGTTVTITDRSGATVGTGIVGADGTFSVVLGSPAADGELLTVVLTDAAGNVSAPANQTVDAVAPDAPVLEPSAGSTVRGTAEPGSTVTVTDPTGVVIATGVAGTDGRFELALAPAAADGTTLTVTAADAAGNVSAASPVTVDSSAPQPAIVDPSAGSAVTGSGEPGATVTVTDGSGAVVGTGTVRPDGTFEVAIDPAAADGAPLTVTLTDGAGNASSSTVTVDASAPDAPVVDPSDGSTVSGSGEAGATVTVTDANGTVVGTGTVRSDGTFELTLDPAVADGTHVTVTVSDAAGNTSPGTAVTVDAAAPTAPEVGVSDGTAVTGSGEPGATVTVTDANGAVIGTGTVGADGGFRVELSPTQPHGSSIVVTLTDAAGNASSSGTIVDADAPAAPVVDPTDGGSVSGTGEAGTEVTVTAADGTVLGTTTVNSDGTFSLTLSPAGVDGDRLTVTLRDEAGNAAATQVTVDAAAPDAPIVDPSDGTSVTGAGEPGTTVTVTDASGAVIGTATVAPDGTFVVALDPAATDGAQLTVTLTDAAGNAGASGVTVDATAPEAPVVAPSNGTTVSGSAEPGAQIVVTDGSGNVVGTGTVGPDGAFELTLTPPAGDGETLTVTVTDPAGNSGSTETTVDAVGPQAPVVDASDGSTVSGTGEPGAIVTVTGKDGVTIGTGTVSPDGTFTVELSPRQEDGDPLTVTLTDPAGNASGSVETSADSTSPDAPVVHPSSGTTVTGSGEPGATVAVADASGAVIGSATVGADGTFTVTLDPAAGDGDRLTVTLTDAAGNTSAESALTVDASAPTGTVVDATNGHTVTGSGEPGATVTVTTEDGTVIGTAKIGEDGTFEVTLSPVPGDGETITVTVTDPAGNSVSTELTTDQTAPGAPVVDPSDGRTVTGAGEPGATVTVTAADGSVVGTATVAPDGTFSIEILPAAADGSALSITLTDTAGNASETTSVTVDAVAPAAPVVEATDGSAVSGTGEAGATVTVTDADGTVLATGTVRPDGTFDLPLSPAPADGSTLTVTLTDLAGNSSGAGHVVVDSSAPEAPVVAPTNGSSLTGTGEAGSGVVVLDASGTVIGTGTVDADGRFSVTLNPAAADGATLSVVLTDAAGNRSPSTSVSVDAAAPSAPVVAPTDGTAVSGTGEPGAVVTVTDQVGTVIATGTVGADGTFRLPLSPKQVDGSTVAVTLTDAAGNTSEAATRSVDAVAPSTPVVTGNDGTTVTGTGEPGSTVTITDAAGTVIGTGTVDSDGHFTVTLDPAQPAGSTITVVVTDASGNVSATRESTVTRTGAADAGTAGEGAARESAAATEAGSLASTGSDISGTIAAALLAMLSGFAVLFGLGRRRRREQRES